MKLQRFLATTAVMAAVGPAALLAAPAAHAEGVTPSPSVAPSTSASAPAGGHTSPTPNPGRPSGGTNGGTSGGSDGGARPSTSAHPGTGTSAQPGASANPGASASTKPGPSASGTPGATPSPSWSRPTFCSGIPDEERGKTSLRGLPGKIVAGSGWHEFTYRVSNVSKTTVMETDVSIFLGTADPKLHDTAQLAVTVEWFNPNTGQWKAIEGGDAGVFDNYEFATAKQLKPGEYADARMRIRIGDKATPGTGYFFTIGHSFGTDGQCGFDDISEFDFTVLAPGSKPGSVGDSKGKPAKPGTPGLPDPKADAGNKPAPQGGRAELPVSGRLAETGSSSTLPTVAALGGAAVVAGAGAVFLVRRRRATA
ncbi:LPXTG cell wall anchor domain-containing protein [Streptomyces sp. NBC_00249]|uniref:LAETG motif-containing sortase-dependent surface protein n=1 Tax=Streptomyces sp. NBC_00249 TaxID=2975690 RepID=UPI0022510BE3|nr:LAETG motif-containing sortase-dependent surface protein [Streptomyces sp. NBC_00249]MCX5197079.1 LPXTG cell wall anchor domain-containing protein [Streptomyces sp. NBC_00249]